MQGEFGSFDAYLWGFFGGALPRPDMLTGDMVPATTPESDTLSADLKRRGFKFVGSTIVYAYMQSVGARERPRHGLLPRAVTNAPPARGG